MFKYLLSTCALTFLFAAQANAAFVTTNADVAVAANPDGTGNPVPNIVFGTTGGTSFAYTNVDSMGNIRSIAIDRIGSLTNGETDPVYAPDSTVAQRRSVVVVTALFGFVDGDGNVVFTQGSAFLTSQHTVNFGGLARGDDPSSIETDTTFVTLRLSTGADIFNSPIISGDGKGAIVGQQPFPGGLAFSAEMLNMAFPDGSRSDTFLVFSDELGPGGLLSNVDDEGYNALFPGGPAINFEGVIVDADQLLAFVPVDAADIAVLNAFYNMAGLGNFDDGGYTPGFNGDFTANFQSKQYIITGFVPEPSSVALCLVGLGCLAFFALRRSKAGSVA